MTFRTMPPGDGSVPNAHSLARSLHVLIYSYFSAPTVAASASSAMAARYVEGSYQILPGSPSTTGSDHNAVVARFRID